MANEVATTPQYSDEALANIQSFEDAIALLHESGVAVSDITEYGDGFEVLKDKERLINVPFVLLDYKFSKSEQNESGEFAIFRVVTQAGEKFLVTDGSTGIAHQIQDLRRRQVPGGVLCKKGLSVSEYDYVDEKGKKTPAKTFYLAM